MSSVKPPLWFWAVAVLLLLWNLFGGFVCLQQFRLGADAMGPADAYQRSLFAQLPGWYRWNFVFAEVTGIGGALALLARHRIAVPLFVLSLLGVVVQFGWLFAFTDVIAQEGFGKAAGLPITVFVICLVQVWLARRARARGWIG